MRCLHIQFYLNLNNILSYSRHGKPHFWGVGTVDQIKYASVTQYSDTERRKENIELGGTQNLGRSLRRSTSKHFVRRAHVSASSPSLHLNIFQVIISYQQTWTSGCCQRFQNELGQEIINQGSLERERAERKMVNSNRRMCICGKKKTSRVFTEQNRKTI